MTKAQRIYRDMRAKCSPSEARMLATMAATQPERLRRLMSVVETEKGVAA